MTCQTCRLPLAKQTVSNGHKDCRTCRHNRKQRDYRKHGITQSAIGRIVGEALAKFYKLPTAQNQE